MVVDGVGVGLSIGVVVGLWVEETDWVGVTVFVGPDVGVEVGGEVGADVGADVGVWVLLGEGFEVGEGEGLGVGESLLNDSEIMKLT